MLTYLKSITRTSWPLFRTHFENFEKRPPSPDLAIRLTKFVFSTGASIHFSDWEGREGARVRKFSTFSQSRNIKLCALSAPQNSKLCMFSSIFYVKSNGFVVPDSAFKTYSYITIMHFQVVEIIGGGGAK